MMNSQQSSHTILLGCAAIEAHSMEEAEALCDRLGIFVNGQLQCIGNAKEVISFTLFF
jgi:ABC-type multidrug transport system ATPase subunit